VYDHGAISITDPKIGNTFKVNGQRLKPYIENEQLNEMDVIGLSELRDGPEKMEVSQPNKWLKVIEVIQASEACADSKKQDLSTYQEEMDYSAEEDAQTSHQPTQHDFYKLQSMTATPLEDLPPKRDNLGKLIIPWYIGGKVFYDPLLVVRSKVNAMSVITCKCLNIFRLEMPTFKLKLADDSEIYPKGVARDIIVNIKGFPFPADFDVLDMED